MLWKTPPVAASWALARLAARISVDRASPIRRAGSPCASGSGGAVR